MNFGNKTLIINKEPAAHFNAAAGSDTPMPMDEVEAIIIGFNREKREDGRFIKKCGEEIMDQVMFFKKDFCSESQKGYLKTMALDFFFLDNWRSENKRINDRINLMDVKYKKSDIDAGFVSFDNRIEIFSMLLDIVLQARPLVQKMKTHAGDVMPHSQEGEGQNPEDIETALYEMNKFVRFIAREVLKFSDARTERLLNIALQTDILKRGSVNKTRKENLFCQMQEKHMPLRHLPIRFDCKCQKKHPFLR